MTKKVDLLKKIQLPRNLRGAWYDLNRTRKSSHGLSTETIASFSVNLEQNIRTIRKQLNTGYTFSPVRAAVIPKKTPSGEIKKRGIRVAEIRDRLVQRAICRVIEPILTKKYNLLNEASYAYLKERGIKHALLRMINLYKQGNPVVFESDIVKYFDTVDRKKLVDDMIKPSVVDEVVCSLITQALEQEVGNKDDINATDWEECFFDSGIPQGGGLSPLLANVYLHKFDEIMLSKGFGLVRYADDFIVMCKDKKAAEDAYYVANQFLSNELSLSIHSPYKKDSKTKILKVTQERFEFLGFRFDGRHLYPSTKALASLKMHIRDIAYYYDDKNLLLVLKGLNQLMEGWISAYCYAKIENNLPDIYRYICERTGICAYKMKWIDKRATLNGEQYKYSGIGDLNVMLLKQRTNLKPHEYVTFLG